MHHLYPTLPIHHFSEFSCDPHRIKSRKSSRITAVALNNAKYNAANKWKDEWKRRSRPVYFPLRTPRAYSPVTTTSKRKWSTFNRIHTGQVTSYIKGDVVPNPSYDCCHLSQMTMAHVVHDFPTIMFEEKFENISNTIRKTVKWTKNLNTDS